MRPGQLPRHIGIIMDGNGRWARKHGLPRGAGHKKGADVFGQIARHCRDIGVSFLTVYAFSTENWSRPAQEVQELMALLRQYLRDAEKYQKENIRLCFIGDRTVLDPDLTDLMRRAEEGSRNNTGLTACLAINYGGRDEITRAARRLAEQVARGELKPEEITEGALAENLDTAGMPDPDLIIRPSGEKRSSNFLVWQSSYSEYVFLDILWPDFTTRDLDRAISDYVGRDRRFGGVGG